MGSRPPTTRVLVVDDNRDLAENVAELFTQAGCAAVVAAGAGDAERACAQGCELALIDVGPDGESGIALAGRIRAQCPGAEVILMTANASLDSAIAALQGDAYAYIQKPFDSPELLALGQRAIAKVELQRARARLERELFASEALHRSVINAVEAFIVTVTPTGSIVMWNRSAEAATGLGVESVLGTSLRELLASDRARALFEGALARALAGENVEDLELPVASARGPTRVVRWRLSLLPDHGEPLVLAVGVDRTDEVELQRRAVDAETMASLGTLTAGLAHEIRNPLNAASLQLELLQRAASKLADATASSAIIERVHIVREELSRLTRLLDDFLRLAKPRAIELREVDLGVLLQEVAALHRPGAEQAGIELRVDAEGGPVLARGEAALLKQVIVNLVVNALDAMRERGRGRLVLGCHRMSDSRVELSVEDDGPGIPEAMLDRIFTPFVTTKEAGTGLGLTIVKRIVDRHGGGIHLASAPGEGTRIWITLPGAT